jgi:peptidoglycan/xylan/chitin deacetylase (PgdA/CDA1 family)
MRRPGVVLLYHRVTDLSSDPQETAVSPTNFAAHIEVMHDAAHVVPLRDVGRREEPHVAITFDDGYRDNAHTAAPMLRSTASPATFFVIAGSVGSAEPPWWAVLESLCLTGSNDSGVVEIDVADVRLFVDARTGRGRSRLLWALYRRLRPLPLKRIHAVIDVLSRVLGPPSDPPADDLFVSVDDLAALAADDLFEIGSHTVNHPFLGSQTSEVQERELTDSRRILGDLIGRPVISLSYPYGGPDAFDETTIALARAAGYEYGYIVRDGRVGPDTDQMRIPRCVVKDWDRETFARKLFHWLGD